MKNQEGDDELSFMFNMEYNYFEIYVERIINSLELSLSKQY